MNLISRKARPWMGALLLALSASACGDRRGSPLAPELPAVPPEGGTIELASVRCRVDVPARQITCQEAPSVAGDGLIIGGQNQFVRLTSTNVVATADTLAADITVQNLTPQMWGSNDGVTPTSTGVRVFLESLVNATMINADGVDSFTVANQPYYLYSGALLDADTFPPNQMLSPNETSGAKRWKFVVAPGASSFTFTFRVYTDVKYPNGWIDVTGNPNLVMGSSTQLAGVVRSAGGLVLNHAITWSTSDSRVATVSSSGRVAGGLPGTAVITATSGLRSGSIQVTVSCPATLPGLNFGGVVEYGMPANARFCLTGGAAGAEYVLILRNKDTLALPLGVTAHGNAPVTGAPTPDLFPGTGTPRLAGVEPLRPDDAWERRLRERERRALDGLLRAGTARVSTSSASKARRALSLGERAVGDRVELNVASAGTCDVSDLRVGRVAAVGTRVLVLADSANPAGFSTDDYRDLAMRFDTLVWPAVTAAFGEPADIDENGRVAVFVTRAVNERAAAGAPYVGGYFLRRDLFATTACPASNQGEVMMVMAADPQGVVNGNVRTVPFARRAATLTMGHELQHLVNASRRMYGAVPAAFEEPWLDEGLSQVAEELLFYRASGLQPRQNVAYPTIVGTPSVQGAFFAYAEPNFARLREALAAPQGAHAGGTWAYLRYLADRAVAGGSTENDFWYAIASSAATGMANLQQAVGPADVNEWGHASVVAIYADDAGIGAVPPYTHPSWNFRSVYGGLDYDGDAYPDGFPLAVRDPASGVPDAFTLAVNGSAYLRVGAAAGDTVPVIVQSGASDPPSTARLTIIRRK